MEPASRVARLIEEILLQGDVIPVEGAIKLDARMRNEFPEDHAAYIDSQAQRLYREDITATIRRNRGITSASTEPRSFGSAATAYAANGDPAPLSLFVRWRCRVSDDGTQRTLGDMTGPDHKYVAADYSDRANANAMIAAFHIALAKKVGNKRTADVVDEATVERLYLSIIGQTPRIT
jgi:hypothetical protein